MKKDNVIAFHRPSKGSENDVTLEQTKERFVDLKEKIQANILRLKSPDGCNVTLMFSPIYFNGNEIEERKQSIIDFHIDTLKNIMTDLESEDFENTYLKSDFPALLKNASDLFEMGLPVNIAIPFASKIVTLIFTKVYDNYIISNIYINEKCIHQYALEASFRKFKTSSIEAFGLGPVEDFEDE